MPFGKLWVMHGRASIAKKLVDNMPLRLLAVIKAKGGSMGF